MDKDKLNKAEKELNSIAKLDNEIKYLQTLLGEENERYSIYAYQIKPPDDNIRGYNSVKNVSDPVSKAVTELEADDYDNYVTQIKEDIKELNTKRINLVTKYNNLKIEYRAKRYGYARYVCGKSVKEAISIAGISETTSRRYKTEILTQYNEMYNP